MKLRIATQQKRPRYVCNRSVFAFAFHFKDEVEMKRQGVKGMKMG